MKLLSTTIEGVSLVEINLFQDLRGSFSRLFCESDFSSLLGTRKIIQINRSLTVTPGTVRGMHFQYPPTQKQNLFLVIRVGFGHDDPQLGITWPLPITNLSDRDQEYPLISQDFNGIRI